MAKSVCGDACLMEGRLDMATRKRLANRFKAEYAKGTKRQKGEVLDRLVAVGMGRPTARRLLSQAVKAREKPGAGRGRKPTYGEDAQRVLERLWLLMGMPCGPYMKAMFGQWIPALRANGELDGIDGAALEQAVSMSASTIDRRLRPLKQAAMPRGMSLTRPAADHLRNSVRIRKCTDEIARLPGLAEADTVAHCGPSARGEFARTLTMVDYATNWTINRSARNNAKSNIRKAVETAIPLFPFPVTCLDSDNGVESGNDELIDWLQMKDIEQTRSRPYRKNDQATVESRNNHVVRKFAFHWRYDAPEQLDLLNRLWEKTCLLLNLFTPTRKPIRVEQGRDGRRKTVYDKPRTPWARALEHDAENRAAGGQGYADDATRQRIEGLIASANPAQPGREIAAIQDELERISRERTEAMARRQGLDMGYLGKAIERMRADAEQDNK